jgi:cysteine desulfurase / selenocysteine lyase
MNAFDVSTIRKDFPILDQNVHGQPLAYLDNAATTQKPKSVINRISRFYSEENSNIHRGVHWLSQQSTLHYEHVRKQVKDFIHAADEREIIFLRGTTEAINLVAQSYGATFLKAGDEILISELEHHANIIPWQILCQKINCILKVAPINEQGEIILEEYVRLLNPKTKLVALNHISNALGTINPVEEMTHLAKRYGAKVLIDGAQAVAHMPVDVQSIGCDFYAFSGHKFFAPSGVGILYGKLDLLEAMPPWQAGGNMIKYVSFEKTLYNDVPYKFEAGTPNIEGALGLGSAIDYFQSLDWPSLQGYENNLRDYATEALNSLDDVTIIGDSCHKIGIFSFVMANIHAHDIGTILDLQGVAVRTGHHCAMPTIEHFKLPATTRASLAFYNTKTDIDRLIEGLKEVRRIFK